MTSQAINSRTGELQEIISRADARDMGLKRYFSGKPCIKSHVDQRYVSDKKCLSCTKERLARWVKRNPEKSKAIKDRHRLNNIEEIRSRQRERFEQDPEPSRAAGRRYARKNAGKLKEYREKNKEKISANRRRWYLENRETILEKQRLERASNPEKYKERKRLANAKNPEPARARTKKWREENPEKYRHHQRARRAAKLGADGAHSADDVESLFHLQKGKCHWCKKRLTMDTKTVDHIIPLSKGGSDNPSNLCIACRDCNSSKHAKDPLDFAREKGWLI